MPGTEDDIKYVHRNSSGGGGGYGNRLVGRGAYKPVIEIMDAALEAMEPQTVGLISNFYDTYQSFKKGQEMSRIHSEYWDAGNTNGGCNGFTG